LNELKFKNLPYHAGLSDEVRHDNQERFIREEVNIIVATVAFGMGIDRPDIRFVIHAAMPKSIEHYHQETGRAGRDGLPSYCYMFYGGQDFRVWSYFLGQSPNREVMMQKLQSMYNFCTLPQCRHRELVNYFNQQYQGANCQACDYCLEEMETVDNAAQVSRKILGCIEEITYGDVQGFGAGYITVLLKGSMTEQIDRWHHGRISSFGVMAQESLVFIRFMIEQLVGQGFLKRTGEYSTLSLTDSGRRLMRGEATARLVKPLLAKKKKEISARQKEKRSKDWAGVDEELFELLRKKRAELSARQGVPAYIIFGDRSLKDMAAEKPLTREAFATVYGVGEHKLKRYAKPFIGVIQEYVETRRLS
ncbi:MAG: RQC domain-containing protein, partial [Candidatus Omnitrophota bacterium]